MPMLGPASVRIGSLSSPAAANPWAKLPHDMRGRLMPRSFCSAISSRYRRRLGFDRSMIRSVTRATVALSVIVFDSCGGPRLLLVPADPVALGQRNRGGRSPGAGGIRPRCQPRLRPGGADGVDPGPLRLDLVAAHEQGGVPL